MATQRAAWRTTTAPSANNKHQQDQSPQPSFAGSWKPPHGPQQSIVIIASLHLECNQDCRACRPDRYAPAHSSHAPLQSWVSRLGAPTPPPRSRSALWLPHWRGGAPCPWPAIVSSCHALDLQCTRHGQQRLSPPNFPWRASDAISVQLGFRIHCCPHPSRVRNRGRPRARFAAGDARRRLKLVSLTNSAHGPGHLVTGTAKPSPPR